MVPRVATAPLQPQARIGPNSVLQLLPLLDEALGRSERERLLHSAGMAAPPSSAGLMSEGPAASLHQRLRAEHPDIAARLTQGAGERTGEYIIQQRIPPAALLVLRRLPAWLAGPLLGRVIEKHAWTFAGSGRFRIVSLQPAIFEIVDNPVVRGETAAQPICHWHAAVFARLYRHIVDPGLDCRETQCCASGAPACRFEIA